MPKTDAEIKAETETGITQAPIEVASTPELAAAVAAAVSGTPIARAAPDLPNLPPVGKEEPSVEGYSDSGHDLSEDVLRAVEEQAQAFDTNPDVAARFGSKAKMHEYLIASHIVGLYAAQPSVVAPKAPAVYDAAKVYVVAHSAISGHSQGEIVKPLEGWDMQRLLDLGAIVESEE